MIFSRQKKLLQHWLNQLFEPQEESAEYQAWKQKLFRDRLIVYFWILLPCITAFAIKDFTELYLPENSQQIIEYSGREKLELYRTRTIYPYSAIALSWILCWYRFRKDRFKRHTSAIFLSLAWSNTIYSPILGTFIGEPYLGDIFYWGIIFLGLAIIIPVRWRLHLVTQLSLIIYYFVIMPIVGRLGLTEVDMSRVFDPDRTVPFFLACSVSIIAISMYERLQQKQFESQRELKVFLHSVTHDLRTPVMASSIVLKNILQQPGNKLTLDRSVLERLHQGSDRAYRMINSVIEAYNTEVNGIIVNLQPYQICNLINSALIDLQPILLEHQAIVDNRLPCNLPNIMVDPTQIWRVLSNLIGNALKHNPDGILITIDAVVEPNWLYCSISDNGVGISAEQCDRIFKLYSRGKRSRYMPGLGIGLYLSQQIVMAHGGEIGVISNLGNGSTFWFTLPCQPEQL